MFSERLKELRKKQGLSQSVLAEYLSISRQAISRYEKGSAEPDLKNLTRIANYFDVSTDYLLGNENQPAIVQSSLDHIFVTSIISWTLSAFSKFTLSPVLAAKADEPTILLCGIDKHTFWGEHSVQLAFYPSKDAAEKEIEALYRAISNGHRTYTLQFFVPTTNKGRFGIKILDIS